MASRTMWLAALAGLLLAAGAAQAQSGDDEFSPGPYFSFAGSWGLEQFDSDGIRVDDGVGMSSRVGFRALRYLAAEVQHEYFPGFDSGIGFLRTHALTANVKGFLVNDNTGPFEPYALAGVGGIFASQRSRDDEGVVVRFGGGANLKFSEHVALVLEGTYVWPTSADVDDLQYVSVNWGLQLSF